MQIRWRYTPELDERYKSEFDDNSIENQDKGEDDRDEVYLLGDNNKVELHITGTFFSGIYHNFLHSS